MSTDITLSTITDSFDEKYRSDQPGKLPFMFSGAKCDITHFHEDEVAEAERPQVRIVYGSVGSVSGRDILVAKAASGENPQQNYQYYRC